MLNEFRCWFRRSLCGYGKEFLLMPHFAAPGRHNTQFEIAVESSRQSPSRGWKVRSYARPSSYWQRYDGLPANTANTSRRPDVWFHVVPTAARHRTYCFYTGSIMNQPPGIFRRDKFMHWEDSASSKEDLVISATTESNNHMNGNVIVQKSILISRQSRLRPVD